MVTLPPESLRPFEAFTCFNSPYVAHDDGSAIDLYPGSIQAPSPVSGEVIAIERVRAPRQPYARAYDYILAIDTRGAAGSPFAGSIARLLHVDPSVSIGDTIDIGDEIGTMIRAGFFAPWVANHIHLEFRHSEADIRRASGSIPFSLDVQVTPFSWDGTGIVTTAERTFVELETDSIGVSTDWVGLAEDSGRILDGGLPHYPHGGFIDGMHDRSRPAEQDTPRLLGTTIGSVDGSVITWDDITVTANGHELTGLSLFVGRPDVFSPKLVCPGHHFEVGDEIAVSIDATDP